MSLSAVNNINSIFRQDSCDGIGGSAAVGSGALLDMLAEVASQKLYNEVTSENNTNNCKDSSDTTSRQNKKKLNLAIKYCEGSETVATNSKRNSHRSSDVINKKPQYQPYYPSNNSKGSLCYRMTASQIRALSAGQLIRLFTILEGDEIKKTFYFQCRFLPTCNKRFFSFGSEEKARHLVKQHLNDHVQDLHSDTFIEVPHKYELNRRNSCEKHLKKIPNGKINNKSSLKEKRKVISSEVKEREFGDKAEERFEVQIKPMVVTKSSSLINDSEVYSSTTVAASVSPSFERVISNDAVKHIELIRDHNYYRYLHMNNSVTASNISCYSNNNNNNNSSSNCNSDDGANELTRTPCNDSQKGDTGNNIYSLEKQNKTDSCSSLSAFKYVIHNQLQPVTSLPDVPDVPVSAHSDVDNDGIVVKMEESSHQLIPVHTAVDMSVDYITPVGHEVVVETENAAYEVNDNIINDVNNCRNNDQICQPYNFEENVITDVEVSNCIKRSNFTPDETLKSTTVHHEKKPKGKAKFIGQSAEEREMAVEMIKALKSDKGGGLECQICRPKRVFTAPTTLISHYRSHAGIKPYECLLCKAVFTRQHSLNYHLLIHLNQTRFTCDVCGRKFRHPSHFKEHQRRHTGESPFHCPDCTLRFKTRNTYKRHLKTRHGKILMHSGTIVSDAPITKTASKMTEIKTNKIDEEMGINSIKNEIESVDDTITNSTVMTISGLRECHNNTISIINNSNNNDLDKENNSNTGINCKGKNCQNITTSDVLTRRVSASVISGVNLIKQNHITTNNNSGAILLSIVPSLQHQQQHSSLSGTKAAAVLLLTTGKTSSNDNNVIIDGNASGNNGSSSNIIIEGNEGLTSTPVAVITSNK
ncbi:uncharacterized protein LOC142324423 [Lycorma delicatula]|uniref:uncharacterized protein LOC142324423 n=1 Tax=Lycorma delicatula TaxID=130591 RepID=UPI003F5148BE